MKQSNRYKFRDECHLQGVSYDATNHLEDVVNYIIELEISEAHEDCKLAKQ